MDRRQLLALTPLMPLLATGPAAACSYALISPIQAARRSHIVATLFQRWWQRDKVAFRRSFTDRARPDGEPIPENEAKELFQLPPISEDTFAMFDRFFTNGKAVQRIRWTLDTPAGLIVACSEFTPMKGSDRSCGPLPVLHLFFVETFGLNPRALTHIATTTTPQPDVASLSMGNQRY